MPETKAAGSQDARTRDTSITIIFATGRRAGRPTPPNLLTLCRFHHRKVHEGGITIQVLDDGALRFIKPNGQSIDSLPGQTQTSGDWKQLPIVHQQHGIHIDKHTAISRWCGETMDYGVAIDAMLYRLKRARNVSAETPQ